MAKVSDLSQLALPVAKPAAASANVNPKAEATIGAVTTPVAGVLPGIDSPFGISDFNFDVASAVNQASIRNRLLSIFGPLMGGAPRADPRITVSDVEYVYCPIRFIRGIAMSEPMLTPGAYRAEVFDCDDYVQFLKVKVSLYAAFKAFTSAPAVGFLLTEAHAFNFCFDPDGRFYILNTQSEQRAVESDPSLFAQFLGLVDQNNDPVINNRIDCIYI